MKRFIKALVLCSVIPITLVILILCSHQDVGPRPLRAGDIVIHKLGRRGVITMKSIPLHDIFNVRVEDGNLEYWTAAEIEYRESQ